MRQPVRMVRGINPYLDEAGVPPRPRGYTWFIRVWPPDLAAHEFLEQVDRALISAPPEVVMPSQWRQRMEEVLTEVYARRP